jgi:hypothetical protein
MRRVKSDRPGGLSYIAAVAVLLAVHINITDVAAGTTVAVNVLEIKSTVAKARAAAKATKKVAIKVAKKVAGK